MLTSGLRPESETRLWYEEKVRRYGYDHRGLGFRTRSSQEKRFNALLRLGSFDGRRVLDVGCGFGDLLAFLMERNIRPVYSGLDICAPMVARCHQRFPVSAGIFAVGDVLDYQPRHEYDYVVASGIFGLDAPGARERVEPTIARMFEWARLGVAVNFLSARAAEKVDNRLYVDPCEALEWGFRLTPCVRVDHDYLPNDFTLFLHRTPTWAREAIGGNA
jgi:SAM-dependent methyltransferase